MNKILTFKDFINYNERIVNYLQAASLKGNTIKKTDYTPILRRHNKNQIEIDSLIKAEKDLIKKNRNSGDTEKNDSLLIELSDFVMWYSISNIHNVKDEKNNIKNFEGQACLFYELSNFIFWYCDFHHYTPKEKTFKHIEMLIKFFFNVKMNINSQCDVGNVDNFLMLRNSKIVTSYIDSLLLRVKTDIEKIKLNNDNSDALLSEYNEKANSLINDFNEIAKNYGLKLNNKLHFNLLIEPLTILKTLPPQQTTNESETIRYTAKHYVLAYLIECNAKGESFPIGQKKELEKIGSQRIGAGKGHRFYREFNNITNQYDINKPSHLIEIGGENWRTIVKDLSNEPETIETYLQSKQL